MKGITIKKRYPSAIFLKIVFWYNDEKKSKRDMFLDECEDATVEVADERV